MAIILKKHVTAKIIFILALNLRIGNSMRYEKPVATSIWKEPCNKHSRILNDCNWCKCSKQGRYVCDARVCGDVDMFGHFNDAIRDIDVGMEGHGVWRSTQTACEPGVHYQRGSLLCICAENGTWPNPICRDTFRVLHQVQIVENVTSFKEEKCTPSKLYLIGCNVCYCPETGIPNPKFCTRKVCNDNDPIFSKSKERYDFHDIYAECETEQKYKLGCKECVCLKNNILLCGNCSSDNTQCQDREPKEVFEVDCNICRCDSEGLMYCSVKRCIQKAAKDKTTNFDLPSVDTPHNDLDCSPGTKYKRDCNTCYCFESQGIKKFGCTMNKCSDDDDSLNDCVIGTTYEMDCLLCQCGWSNNRKIQICQENPNCKTTEGSEYKELRHMRGYCEPMHTYKDGCNVCQCLPDGKTVQCTAHICREKTESITVDLIPVVQDVGSCASGHSFMIDCNVCYCVDNNVVCTTNNCDAKH